MMNRLRYAISVICVWLTTVSAAAQGYKTEKLQRAASQLGISAEVEAMTESQSALVKTKDGQSVTVRTDALRMVEHIGIPLFKDQMRVLMPSPVYDFLEYAVLNWKYKINPNTLYLSKVLFRKGNWQTLASGSLSDVDCNISNQDDRLYIVNWQREGQDVATIGIPIEYELLANDTRRNMERDFIRHLEGHRLSVQQQAGVKEEDLKIYGTEGLFVMEGESYLMPELNQNVYYILKTVYETKEAEFYGKKETVTLEEVVPQLVISDDHPNESFANIVMADHMFEQPTRLDLDFHLSDYHRRQLAVSCNQLTDFCRRQGAKVYFASSGVKDGMLRGVLLVNNMAEGYNHLFSLRMPVEQIATGSPVVQGDAYLYIPPIDKSKLFGKTPTRKSGAKIYN